MIHLELSAEEVNLLRGILTSYRSELHTEIHHTDNRGYRQTLKSEQELLRDLLHRLESPRAHSAAR